MWLACNMWRLCNMVMTVVFVQQREKGQREVRRGMRFRLAYLSCSRSMKFLAVRVIAYNAYLSALSLVF